jgi:hypothetical protein
MTARPFASGLEIFLRFALLMEQRMEMIVRKTGWRC